ncbi:mannosyltransferase putative-domain-containing protein [Podospora aff. communis PSN243]|uniref:Mannosyltransferase putative-domain-containing protein n=1 Tax=Podospora aff. communis PSN243 TaxID=3040156 RepID=A0AAV9GD00_9PEZI|nr:mannosyltransferase putative-domain-containing protein [Podospora aff. communis PSN243]
MGLLNWRSNTAKRVLCSLMLLLFLSCLFTGRPHDSGRPLPRSTSSEKRASTSWEEYFYRLEAARPWADPVRPEATPSPSDKRRPYTTVADPDLPRLSRETKKSLRHGHSIFVSGLASLATRLVFEPKTTGIVTSVRPDDLGQLVSMLLMLRQSGSTLPVQVVLEDEILPSSAEQLCSTGLRSLGATCILPQQQDGWLDAARHLPPFQPSQWKSLAIIASTFQNVLFLDASTLPVQKPDYIFAKNAEPFASTGLITWTDIWTPTASPDFYAVAGDIDTPLLATRASSESGVLVIDKARHADTLLLAAYYNHYGPDYYYPLLAPHDVEDPGRETFLTSALVLESLDRKGTYTAPEKTKSEKKGRWSIRCSPRIYQRSNKGGVPGVVVMAQVDPLEDYHAVLLALQEEEWSQGSGQEQTQLQGDYRDLVTDPAFLDGLGNLTVSPRKGKYMFFHHYGEKLDFSRVTDDLLPTDTSGLRMRMWGDPDWVEANTGRDVEKMLWEDATEFWCGQQGYGKQCRLMKSIYRSLYVPDRFHR